EDRWFGVTGTGDLAGDPAADDEREESSANCRCNGGDRDRLPRHDVLHRLGTGCGFDQTEDECRCECGECTDPNGGPVYRPRSPDVIDRRRYFYPSLHANSPNKR